jgi:hypothetical protein
MLLAQKDRHYARETAAMLQRWIQKCQSRPKMLLAAWALLLAAQVGPWWYSSIDSTSYLSMARSLGDGTGPTNLGSPLLWYSPGYPALISPFFLLADRPFLWIAVLQWLLAVALMLGVYRWAGRSLPEAAIWIAGLTVINHGFWIHFRRPLSEIAFMCVLIWAIEGLRELTIAARRARFAAILTAGAALVALLSIIRPVGIMLVPAFAVWACRERSSGRWPWRRTLLATALVAAAGVLPVGWFVMHERSMVAQTGGRSYLDNFDDAARSPWESYSRGVQLCVSDLGRVTIPGLFKSHGRPGDWTDINMLIHVPLFLLLCLGWRRWLERENSLFAWYLPFYLLLIAVHAMDTGARLLLPLLPALFVCLWYAGQRIGRGRQSLAVACLSAQLIVAGSYWLAVDLPRSRHYDRLWPAIDELASRIQDDPGSVMVSQLDGETELRLELALDGPVHRQPDMLEQAQWLITPGDRDAPAGYQRSYEAGPLALWSAGGCSDGF